MEDVFSLAGKVCATPGARYHPPHTRCRARKSRTHVVPDQLDPSTKNTRALCPPQFGIANETDIETLNPDMFIWNIKVRLPLLDCLVVVVSQCVVGFLVAQYAPRTSARRAPPIAAPSSLARAHRVTAPHLLPTPCRRRAPPSRSPPGPPGATSPVSCWLVLQACMCACMHG